MLEERKNPRNLLHKCFLCFGYSKIPSQRTKMSLTILPEEVIIIIIKKLDLRSVYNLYNTCTYMRNLVCMHGVIKEAYMSLNTMATAKTLKMIFFKDIAKNLQVLDMSGVHDLSKSVLLPVMKMLKSLQTLNVAYTNINIDDLAELYDFCPTIKNISVNFQFFSMHTICMDTVHKQWHLFESLENINFVGSYLNLMQSGMPEFVLGKTKLNNLTYTIVQRNMEMMLGMDSEYVLRYNHFRIFLLNWKISDKHNFNIFEILDTSLHEFIVIKVKNFNNHAVYCSMRFESLLKNILGIKAKTNISTVELFEGDICILIWNKETTKFDDNFFLNVSKQVSQYFPCNKLALSNTENFKNNWFCMFPDPLNRYEAQPEKYEPSPKRRRAPPNIALNYNEHFKDKDLVELSLHYQNNFKNPITLSSDSTFLRKLTYLSLTGTVRYSVEFFNILFRCCNSLLTLNVEAPAISPCAFPISRSLPLSQSLKNLRIMDKSLDFKTLFSACSQCRTLENVHFLNISIVPNNVSDPRPFFQRCDNLYYVFIFVKMSHTAYTKTSQMFNKAKTDCDKLNLRIEISYFENFKYNYDPFISVFRLSTIKPL